MFDYSERVAIPYGECLFNNPVFQEIARNFQNRRTPFWKYFSTTSAFFKYLNLLICVADLFAAVSYVSDEKHKTLHTVVIFNASLVLILTILWFPVNMYYKIKWKFYKILLFSFCQLVVMLSFFNLLAAFDAFRLNYLTPNLILFGCSVAAIAINIIDYWICFNYGQREQFNSLLKFCNIFAEDTEDLIDTEQGTNFDARAESEYDEALENANNQTTSEPMVIRHAQASCDEQANADIGLVSGTSNAGNIDGSSNIVEVVEASVRPKVKKGIEKSITTSTVQKEASKDAAQTELYNSEFAHEKSPSFRKNQNKHPESENKTTEIQPKSFDGKDAHKKLNRLCRGSELNLMKCPDLAENIESQTMAERNTNDDLELKSSATMSIVSEEKKLY